MANITHNHIHETLDAPTLATIYDALNQIISLLPDGTLTPPQRKSYRSMDVRNLVFVQDVLRIKKGSGGNLLPASLNNDNLETDLELFKQIDGLRSRAHGLMIRLTDIERIVGHEAYSTALVHHKVYQMASQAGMPGATTAVEALDWRFKGHGPNKGKKVGPM